MRVQAPANEGTGIKFPVRDPLHEDPQWYERDLDDALDLLDLDPTPLTDRQRRVPGFDYGDDE